MKCTIGSIRAFIIYILLIVCSSCQQDRSVPAQPPPVITPVPPVTPPATATTSCDYDLNETALTDSGWTKTFEDDFATDLSKWNTWTGGAYNDELQYYQAGNLQVADGNLIITAKNESVTGATTPFNTTEKTFNFTSGRIECKTTVSANATTPKVRMAARIKLPAGYGLWPAFWSYGDPWPTQGEIDFLEARGQDMTKYQTNYFYGPSTSNVVQDASGFITADADLSKCYHVFEMVWEQNFLTSYLDGKVVEVKTSGGYIPSLFGKTERIVLNLAVGGNFFNDSGFDATRIQTGAMYVDWVKVFTSK